MTDDSIRVLAVTPYEAATIVQYALEIGRYTGIRIPVPYEEAREVLVKENCDKGYVTRAVWYRTTNVLLIRVKKNKHGFAVIKALSCKYKVI